MGISSVFLFTAFFFKIFQPQITASLLAISIFLLISTKSKVGCKPDIPGIAEIDMSDFLNLNVK